MRAEWFEAADNARNAALRTDQNDQIGALWIAIAAVAPLIAKAERERCARVALRYPISEDENVVSAHGRAMQSMAIAAAIRALD